MVATDFDAPVILIDSDDRRRSEIRKMFSNQFRVDPLDCADEIGSNPLKAKLYLVSDEQGNFEKLIQIFLVYGEFAPVVLYSEVICAERVVRCSRDGAIAYLAYPFSDIGSPHDFINKYAQPSSDLSYFQKRSRSQKALKVLTPREIEVLMGLCEGRTALEVAEKLRLSPKTVDAHRTKMLKKLGVNSIVAVRMAAEAGWTLTSPIISRSAADGSGDYEYNVA